MGSSSCCSSFATPRLRSTMSNHRRRGMTSLSLWAMLALFLPAAVDSFNKFRDHRRHLPVPHSSASSEDQSSDSGEFALHNECYYRYTNTDHHYSFLHWLHHKNVSHYSPISPSYEKALRKIQPGDIKDGLQITTGTPQSCDRRKMKPIHSGMPIIERSLCQYEYSLNYNPNRIPATLAEVQCTCTKPFYVGSRQVECQPLRYHVRVLLFEPDCLNYVEHTETISLACVPVFKATADDDDPLIDVPAEAPI